jgi:hypothetical protein
MSVDLLGVQWAVMRVAWTADSKVALKVALMAVKMAVKMAA